MMDIDKFKVYNDTFGHPAGDQVIASVAKTASSHLSTPPPPSRDRLAALTMASTFILVMSFRTI